MLQRRHEDAIMYDQIMYGNVFSLAQAGKEWYDKESLEQTDRGGIYVRTFQICEYQA